MSRLRTWWHGWRCHDGHHVWEKIHPAIWNGGYYRCAWCPRRTVKGGDTYGPAASAWIARGTKPPGWGALLWTAEDWADWDREARA